MSRRLMLRNESGAAPNGLVDKSVSGTVAYTISDNVVHVTLAPNYNYLVGAFKRPFPIRAGDTIFLQITNASGDFGGFQRWRFGTSGGTTVIINDNVSGSTLKRSGITVSASADAEVVSLRFAYRTGGQTLPASFRPVLRINGVDMIQ